MKNFLRNLFSKTKKTVEGTFENASGEIKEVVDEISEDAGKLVEEGKVKFEKAKQSVREEFKEHVGEPSELKEKAKRTIAEIKEDAGKLVSDAKEKLSEVAEEIKEEFTEHVGEPSEIIAKAKKTLSDTGEKISAAAKEEWASASEKIKELKDSLSGKDESQVADAGETKVNEPETPTDETKKDA